MVTFWGALINFILNYFLFAGTVRLPFAIRGAGFKPHLFHQICFGLAFVVEILIHAGVVGSKCYSGGE